jgi:hypothetical protein
MDWTDGLVGANVALYLLLTYQLIQTRKSKMTQAGSLIQAFGVLDEEVKKRLPSLPPGHTWRDVVAEAKRRNLRVDWPSFGKSMVAYEELRYGGSGGGGADYREVLEMAKELKRLK